MSLVRRPWRAACLSSAPEPRCMHRWSVFCLVCAVVLASACEDDDAAIGDAGDADIGIDAPATMDGPAGTLCANDGRRCAVDQACCSVPPCEDTGWCYFWCCTP